MSSAKLLYTKHSTKLNQSLLAESITLLSGLFI